MSIILHWINGVSLGFEFVSGEALDEEEINYAIVVDLFILRIVFEKLV